MKTTFMVLAALLIVSNAQASSTQIVNGACTYTDDSGVKAPCTPAQQAAAQQQLQNSLSGVQSLIGQIDPKISQPSMPAVSIPKAPSFGSFDLSSFLASYGIK